MKILWLSHLIPYPPKGGVLQRSYHMLYQLSRYHELDLLAFNQKSLISSLYVNVENGINEAFEKLTFFCNRVQFFDIPSVANTKEKYKLAVKSLFNNPYNINWLKSEVFNDYLNSLLKSNKYDLVHFDTISFIPYLQFIKSSSAMSLDHHNIESHMLLRRAKNEKNFLKKIYFLQEGFRLKKYEEKFCPRFNLNITCSDIDSNRLLVIAPAAKVKSIPNGVDLGYFNSKGDLGFSNRIIFIGTMNWYPNIQAVEYIAEKLWPLLKLRHPDLVCDIIGANPPFEIRRLSEKFSDFNIHGFVDDIRPHLEAATVYLCPIRDGGGTKLKILDAFAMQKAMVAHPIACEGINVTHGLNVLLADNDAAFIDQVSLLLQSPLKRKALGVAARSLVEQNYGYEAIGKKLSDALQECVEQSIKIQHKQSLLSHK